MTVPATNKLMMFDLFYNQFEQAIDRDELF
jgi:hypothetical protein